MEQVNEPPTVPTLYALPAPLSPPAQPLQSYRALVNGLHVLPPALSWVAQHQIQPDRIRDNLKYITTAYSYAEVV